MSIPNVSGALRGWTKKTTVKVVTKKIVNYRTVEDTTDATLDLMITPMGPERVARKPEEQRSWAWYVAHIKSLSGMVPLKLDDKIIMPSGKTYRVQGPSDWSMAGFYAYEMAEDYQ